MIDINVVIAVFIVGVLLLGAAAVRSFGLSNLAYRWAQAIPAMYTRLQELVNQADREHDRIVEEYADEAARTGHDPRLLWVIDQIEVWIEQRYKLKVDINWIISAVENYLDQRDGRR